MIQDIQRIKSRSFKNTFCEFIEVDLTEIENKEPNYISESGSKYFYTIEGVFRYSNHWGRIANCKWRLIDKGLTDSKYKVGFAKHTSFFADNDYENLYFLEFDEQKMNVNYQHKLSNSFDENAILRDSKEITKRLRQAKNILQLTNWYKYYNGNLTITELQKKIIKELVYTNNSLDDIKKKLF